MRKRLSRRIFVGQKDHHDNLNLIDIENGVECCVRQLPKVPRRERPHGNASGLRCGRNTSGGRTWRRRVCVEPEGERRLQSLRQPSARGFLWGWRICGKVGRQLHGVGSVSKLHDPAWSDRTEEIFDARCYDVEQVGDVESEVRSCLRSVQGAVAHADVHHHDTKRLITRPFDWSYQT